MESGQSNKFTQESNTTLEAVQRGDEVVIETGNTTQVKLVAVTPARPLRVLGVYCGKLRMHADFNAPLADDFWLSGRP